MDNNPDSLLNLCLEIEGLLALISRREDSTPDSVYSLLREKAALLNNGISCMNSQSAEYTTDAYIADELTEKSVDNSEVESDEIPVVVTPIDELEIEPHESVDIETTEVPLSDDTDIIAESDEDIIVMSDSTEDCEFAPASCDDTDIDDNYTLDTSDDMVRNDTVHAGFTINDKFRFRRELFGNSDAEMADAISVANAMSSIDEIEDYFYNDLCWDSENDDVKDFMHIITSKFKQ